MTRALEWKGLGFLGKTGKRDEERMSPSVDMELCLKKYEGPAEWVKIKERAGTGMLRITGRASIDMLQARD